MKRTALARRTPMPPREQRMKAVSRKQANLLRLRTEFRRVQLQRRPVCEIRVTGQPCRNPSTDLHEVLSRGRGGSILDEANTLALCRRCHSFVHAWPELSAERGWLEHSGMKRED